MARPVRVGVEYFPHDVNAAEKETLFTIQAEYGNDGYAFWFKLLELLGRQEGLFYDCTDAQKWRHLTARSGVESAKAEEILNSLASLHAIDADLWAKKIIWCQNFTDRLGAVYSKRKVETPTKPMSSCCRKTKQGEKYAQSDTQGINLLKRRH